MDHEDRERLRLTRDYIINNCSLRVVHVLKHLRDEGVINDEDDERIMASDDDQQRASVLLDILPTKGARAFTVFYDSLVMCGRTIPKYLDIVKKLDSVTFGGASVSSQRDRIQVFIRVRPLRGEEKRQGEGCLTVDAQNNKVSIHQTVGTPNPYIFDKVFPEETTQAEVFNTMASPIVDAVLEGYNGCILCYGKTGSGKSYTMVGPSNKKSDDETEGIIYRTIKQLFQTSEGMEDWDIKVSVSVLEIYNEKVFDLTVTERNRKPLDIHLFSASNLKKHWITSADDAIKLFLGAVKARHTRGTAANKRSSRSHMILQSQFVTGTSGALSGGAPPGR
ncbi:Chromosome-associated kinesin kif4a [Branchiostoma belcheri]|nr:Chromosome-associated kinesin kif4a [Branchiostoma belcheri]